MKKTLVLAALLAGTLSAQAAFVASGDTYAIINIPIAEGMNAVGINLLPMPGETNLVQNIILPDGLATGSSASTAASLYLFNGSDYEIYWLDNTAGTNWTDSTASPTANPGAGMWIKSPAACTIYQMGRVSADASINIPCDEINNTFVANPYPAALDFDGEGSKINWDGVAVGATKLKNSDLIRIWNGVGYDTYYYYVNEAPAAADLTGKWYNASGDSAPTIPAGEGFWFFRRGGTASINIPIASPF